MTMAVKKIQIKSNGFLSFNYVMNIVIKLSYY